MYIPHQQFTFCNGGAAAGRLTLVLRTAGALWFRGRGSRAARRARSRTAYRRVRDHGDRGRAIGISIGIGIGLAASLVLTRSLVALLYDVPPRDPLTLAAVAATLGAAALLACLAPARRATRVDPMHSLRAE